MKHSRLPAIVTWLVMGFFYLPILVLVANSFNSSRYGGQWESTSLKWYIRLMGERDIWQALRNTLAVAVSATLASMVLGTSAAFALHRFVGSRLQKLHYGLIYMPLVIPEILMGLSLQLFFVSLNVELSLVTIGIAHVTFCLSFVTMTVLARLQDFDFSIVEAAQDLGAGWWTSLWRILIPMLAPGILAGGLLAFTLSIDDFVISFFVAGLGSTTLPIKIYSMIKYGSPPLINALSTILLTVTFVCVLGSHYLSNKGQKAA
ncbi:MAG: ABC transporter permease [Verrucomicrobiota bacterium]|jgi:spermidine/putrescine transport system permease protein|nr:ABC transporter permease [Verrucomicrobiota bacterium]